MVQAHSSAAAKLTQKALVVSRAKETAKKSLAAFRVHDFYEDLLIECVLEESKESGMTRQSSQTSLRRHGSRNSLLSRQGSRRLLMKRQGSNNSIRGSLSRQGSLRLIMKRQGSTNSIRGGLSRQGSRRFEGSGVSSLHLSALNLNSKNRGSATFQASNEGQQNFVWPSVSPSETACEVKSSPSVDMVSQLQSWFGDEEKNKVATSCAVLYVPKTESSDGMEHADDDSVDSDDESHSTFADWC